MQSRALKPAQVLPRLLFVFLGALLFPLTTSATDYSSASYIVKDPVLAPAGYATSTGYSASITIGQPAIGTSTVGVGTVREIRSGFEYFPFVTKPTPTATAGAGQVSLSWTAATGFLGWTVSSYSIGQSTVSGGPYTYTSVGAVLSSTVGSLTNGTTYYFVVIAKDFFGNFIATSTQVSATPVASSTPPPSPGGGGPSGGGGYAPPVVIIPPLTTKPPGLCHSVADLNCDGYVDIIDFSIMYYWFEKNTPPPRADLQRDGTINLGDFSVMAYYWYERSYY